MFDEFQFEYEALAALSWMKRSIISKNFKGSSAKYYHPLYRPFKGWEKSYPETSGYLLSTLKNYDNHLQKENLNPFISSTTTWLLSIQNKNGSFPAGFHQKANPSVFNTAQILLGFIALLNTKIVDIKIKQSAEKAFAYLIDGMQTDGTWDKGNYIGTYNPSYYTRVLWPMIKFDQLFLDNQHQVFLLQTSTQLIDKIKNYQSSEMWSFDGLSASFTHTIAYTLRGIFELGLLVNNKEWIDFVESVIIKLEDTKRKNLFAGSYSEKWTGDHSFTCPTGNLQLAIIYFKMAEYKIEYYQKGLSILEENIKFQSLSLNKNMKGAIPGSIPISGKYQKYAFPIWATKFLLDAIWECNKMKSIISINSL